MRPRLVLLALSVGLAGGSAGAIAGAGLPGSALVVAVTATAAYLASLYALAPLCDVAAALRRIAAGDFAARVSVEGPSELAALHESLNRMASSLGSSMATAAQERSRFAAVLNSSVDAILAVDSESRVRFANAAAERLFDQVEGELVGKPFVWVLANQEIVNALQACQREGGSEERLVELAGRQYFQAIASPIAGGGDWSAVLVFHDLTEVQRAEHTRRDFVANVSHELRTPLASIKAVLETLQAGAGADPAIARDFTARAEAEVDRIVQLVEELLELSRVESGVPLAMAPVALAEVIGRAVDRLRPQAEALGVELVVNAEPLPPVSGDATRLERVVLNLVDNALKFTPAGGRVEVRAGAAAAVAWVEVRDTGPGIDPRDLPRVFERFFKADYSRQAAGSGLGLALVKHTIEAHGGAVSAESSPGRGSTFRFTLPPALRSGPAG